MPKQTRNTTIGPVQFVVIGLQNDKMKGQVAREIHAASQKGLIRVLDALAVQKTKDGSIVSLGASDLTPNQRMEYGAVVGALMGLGATGTEEGLEAGAELGADAFAQQNFGLTDEDIQEIADDIPPGTTAVFVLFEHRWAMRMKEAVATAGGMVLAQGMVDPDTLMMLGEDLAAASAAADQYEMTQSGSAH
jgi:uncharacterized membrane protein